jgi:hypothetical protein
LHPWVFGHAAVTGEISYLTEPPLGRVYQNVPLTLTHSAAAIIAAFVAIFLHGQRRAAVLIVGATRRAERGSGPSPSSGLPIAASALRLGLDAVALG